MGNRKTSVGHSLCSPRFRCTDPPTLSFKKLHMYCRELRSFFERSLKRGRSIVKTRNKKRRQFAHVGASVQSRIADVLALDVPNSVAGPLQFLALVQINCSIGTSSVAARVVPIWIGVKKTNPVRHPSSTAYDCRWRCGIPRSVSVWR